MSNGQHNRYTRLARITRLINANLDIKTLLEHVVTAISEEIIQCDAVGIYLPEDREHYRGYVSKPAVLSGMTIDQHVVDPQVDHLAREVIDSRQSIFIADTSRDDRPDARTIDFFQIRSMLTVPISHGDELFGLVYLFDYGVPMNLTESEIETVEAYVHMAAVAIRNSQAMHNIEELLHEKQTLIEVMEQLAHSQTSDSAIDVCFSHIGDELNNHNVSLHIIDPVSKETVMPSKLSRRSDFEQSEWLNIHERMQMDQTNDKLFQQVVQTKQPLFVEDVAKENRIFQEICDVFNIKSIFMVPMISVGRVLGVIVVAHLGEQPAEYTKAQQRRVESIVNATAPVLIHLYNLESQESIIARRTEEIQSKNEELQRLILEMRKINTEKELIMNTVDEGIIGFSLEGIVMFSNEAAERMLEAETQLFHSIQSYEEILEHIENDEGALSDIFASYLASETVQPVSGEAYMSHPEKGLVTLEYTISSQMEEGVVVGYVLTVRDVTVRKEMEQRIEYYAYYDGTTGLPNRMLVHDRLSQTLREAKEHDQEIAVLFLDLDRFKQINDRFGHAGGDELLTEVAYRLQEMASGAATVARQGGDEFILILPRLENMAQATTTAEQILRVFRNPFYLEGEEVYVKPSIGISFFPLDGHLADDLIQNANSAMHKAKEMNGNTYRAFSSEQMGPDMKKIRLENDLYRALENKELELFYQPQVRLSKNIVIGVEALVRWNHPVHGKIAPSEFIPIAEDTGLITTIGEWILEEACSQAKRWQEQGRCSLRVAVNISAQQFQRECLVDTVKEVLDRTGLAPEFLEIEITENTLLLNTEETVTTMKRLKNIGVRISIDDFGTGYCSLQYLREFPIDTLKIDKVFIDDIKTENSSAPITTTIIALAHSLNLHVIAEGVETLEQQKFLQANKCDLVQGFLYSKPVQASKIPGFCNK